MGFVKSVEYVEFTIPVATQSASSANLTKGQDTANCVPFVTSIVNTRGIPGLDDGFDLILVDIEFTSGPKVTASRGVTPPAGDGGTIDIGCFVVEFDPAKVDVQQGTFTIADTSTSNTASITAVDQSAAAMLFYFSSAMNNDDWNSASVAGWFSADNQLTFQRNGNDSLISGHYYIFEALNGEFSVQASSFAVTGTSNTATISTVDMSKTFVIGSYRTNTANDNCNQGSCNIYLASTTTVAAERNDGTGGTELSDVRTFAITFSGDETVQRGTFTYAASDAQETASLGTSVDTDFAIAHSPNNKQGDMLSDGTGSADVPETFQRLKLISSGASIQGDREPSPSPSSATSGRWEVIQFLESDTGATVTLDPLALAASLQSATITPGVVMIALDPLALVAALQTATITPGVVVIVLDPLALAAALQALGVTPGEAAIALDPLAATAALQTLTVLPGGVSIALGPLALAGAIQALTINTGSSISLSVLALAGSLQTLTVAPGEVTIALDPLALAGAIQAAAVTPGGATVGLSGLALAGSLQTLTVLPGGVVVSLDGLVLAAVLQSVTIPSGGVSITLSPLALVAALQTATITPGAMAVALSPLALAGSLQVLTVDTAVAIGLSPLGLNSNLSSLTITPGATAVTLNTLTLTAVLLAVAAAGPSGALLDVALSDAAIYNVTPADAVTYRVSLTDKGVYVVALSDASKS